MRSDSNAECGMRNFNLLKFMFKNKTSKIDSLVNPHSAFRIPHSNPFTGLVPILRKEAIHIRRDPMALFFTVLIPMVQLFLIGYAINTNVRDIRTVVYDAAKTQESWRLLERFVNSDDFTIVKSVYSDAELNREVIAGRAR